MSLSKFLRNIGIVVLLVLPFQGLPGTLMGRSQDPISVTPLWLKAISYTDEISFFIFLGMGVTFYCLKPGVYRLPRLPFTKWIICFIGFGFFLAAIKGIPFIQATFGIYDLFKNIAVLYIFAMMNYTEEEFLRLIELVLVIGLVLAIVAIFGEFMALTFNYGIELLVADYTRWGIYRIFSLAGNGSHNYIGLYGTLCFLLCYSLTERWSLYYGKKILLLSMIFLTMSRQAWVAFLVSFILFKQWLRYLFPLLPLFIFLIYYSFGKKQELDPVFYLRTYAYIESAKILVAHPLAGLGPGMFGDLASFLWESPVYAQWPLYFKKLVFRMRSLDVFWPVIWGSYGLIGLALYCQFWVSLFIYLGKATKIFYHNGDKTLSNIGKTLKYFMIALAIMGFVAGLNAAFVTYTYFAMVGIYVSLYRRDKEKGNGLSESAQET